MSGLPYVKWEKWLNLPVPMLKVWLESRRRSSGCIVFGDDREILQDDPVIGLTN